MRLEISESGHGLLLSFLKVDFQPESQPESQPEFKLEQRVMALLQSQALGKKQISEALGQINISGQLNKVIRILCDGEYIEPTIPEKPQSRLQEYRLTSAGKTPLEKSQKMILPSMILPRRGRASRVEGSLRLQLSDFRFASFAPAHVALRAACGSVGSHSIPRNVSPYGLFIQPTAQPPCSLVPGQRPLARVQVSGLKPICPARKLLPDFLKGFTLLKTT